MLQPQPGDMTIDSLEYQIKNGGMKIPQFQRSFVWSKDESAKLMDSIIKGYPVGTFIFWKTKERLRSVKNVGNLTLPDSQQNDYVYYVLDGQQRITSIFASLQAQIIGKEDYAGMYVDLKAMEEDSIIITDVSHLQTSDYISLHELLHGELVQLVTTYAGNKDIINKISEYRKKIEGYRFSKIDLIDAPLDIATEVFTRINIGGKSLNVFEIMCAKMYDETQQFDLYERRNEQLLRWENVNYETVAHSTVLQAISACINKSCSRKNILNLKKQDFINVWEKVDKSFEIAIDYFKSFYGIPVSKLLPYDALLVPFVYYFYNHPKKPVGNDIVYLQDYFWRCILNNHFTEGVASKLAQDIEKVIDVILAGNIPRYDHGVDVSISSIRQKGYFSLSSAYVKGLICILSAQHPRSFNDGAEVVIDNAWLNQGNSKNYHHFFPKAFMKKSQPLIEENLVNHIANITIVDGYLNKNLIKDKPPSAYMNDFKNNNKDLILAMNSHLIGDLDDFGIWTDDYNKFFTERINTIQNVLKSKLQLTLNDIM